MSGSAKLDAGVKFGHYVVSYGERSNDYESTSNCTLVPMSYLNRFLCIWAIRADIRKKFGMLLPITALICGC